jgi:hypothetical protein
MGGEDINFDGHFFGFTQLYHKTPGKPVTAEYHPSPKACVHSANTRPSSIVAITSLDGHAYGS